MRGLSASTRRLSDPRVSGASWSLRRLPSGEPVAALPGLDRRPSPGAPLYEAADTLTCVQAIEKEHQPDVVLVDVNSWGGLAEAERWAAGDRRFVRRTGSLPNTTPATRSPYMPPFGPGLPPAHGPLGSAASTWCCGPFVFGHPRARGGAAMLNGVGVWLTSGASPTYPTPGTCSPGPSLMLVTRRPSRLNSRAGDWP